MNPNTEFQADYEAEIKVGLPASGPSPIQIGTLGRSYSEGLVIHVSPKCGNPWIGNLERGSGALDAIARCPDAGYLLAVSGGRGFLIPTQTPQSWQAIPVEPVCGILPYIDTGLLIVHSMTHACAIDRSGLAWVSRRLCWDGLRFLGRERGQLRFSGWDAPNEAQAEFTLDLGSGWSANAPYASK